MAHPHLHFLAITTALSVLPGCVSSSQESSATASVISEDGGDKDVKLETKVGVIDMMEVLKRTVIGQPALAGWKREVQELNRGAYDPRSRKPWGGYKALGTAMALIMPKVETVAQTLAEKHDFAVILQKGTSDTILITLYNADMYDLTEQVIEELNRLYP